MAKNLVVHRLQSTNARPQTDWEIEWEYQTLNWSQRVKDFLDTIHQPNAVSKTAAFTAGLETIYLCDASGGAYTVTLPDVAKSVNQVYSFVKTDSTGNAVTVDGNGSQTINGSTTYALSSQYDAVQIVCNGTAWFVLATK